MRTLFVQAPYPQFYDLLRHVGDHHMNDIGGLIYHTADVSLLNEARYSPVPIILGGDWFPYSGPGTRYWEGMMDDTWRWNMIQSSKSRTLNGLATINEGFIGDKKQPVAFYLTEEIDISSLINHQLRMRVEWFLLDMLRFYHSLDPDLPILWSPYASSTIYSSSQAARFRDLLISVFAWLKNNDGISPRLEVHFQDGVGVGAHSPITARQWGVGLKTAIESTSILSTVTFRMNVEFFKKTAQGYTHESLTMIRERENTYTGAGLEIGACWEGRYWRPYVGYLNNHQETPS